MGPQRAIWCLFGFHGQVFSGEDRFCLDRGVHTPLSRSETDEPYTLNRSLRLPPAKFRAGTSRGPSRRTAKSRGHEVRGPGSPPPLSDRTRRIFLSISSIFGLFCLVARELR